MRVTIATKQSFWLMKEYFQPVGHQPLIQPLKYAYLSVFLVECYFNSYYHIINFYFFLIIVINCHFFAFNVGFLFYFLTCFPEENSAVGLFITLNTFGNTVWFETGFNRMVDIPSNNTVAQVSQEQVSAQGNPGKGVLCCAQAGSRTVSGHGGDLPHGSWL